MPSWLQSTYGSTWTRNDTQWWHECMDGISKPLSAQFSWCLVEECTVKMKMHGELVKTLVCFSFQCFCEVCVSLWSFSLFAHCLLLVGIIITGMSEQMIIREVRVVAASGLGEAYACEHYLGSDAIYTAPPLLVMLWPSKAQCTRLLQAIYLPRWGARVPIT